MSPPPAHVAMYSTVLTVLLFHLVYAKPIHEPTYQKEVEARMTRTNEIIRDRGHWVKRLDIPDIPDSDSAYEDTTEVSSGKNTDSDTDTGAVHRSTRATLTELDPNTDISTWPIVASG